MDVEFFATLMSGIESILVSLAILLGGIWGLISFRSLRETAFRRAQIGHLDAELRKTEEEIRQIELSNRKQAVLAISIHTTQVSLPDDTQRYISVVVSIENLGSRNARLPTSRSPFTVRAVQVDDGDALSFTQEQPYQVRRASDPRYPPPNIIVRAGGIERIPFFCKVGLPGLYLLTFHVSMTKEEQEVAEQEGFSFAGSWVAKEYIIVK